jgi:DDE superfamily endonuclease
VSISQKRRKGEPEAIIESGIGRLPHQKWLDSVSPDGKTKLRANSGHSQRLIFLDESGAKTNLTRLRGRAPRGKRVHASAPHGHWHTTTMICSIRLDGSTACMTIEGATDAEVFRAYVRRVLCPTLRKGDLVIMNKLSPHKSEPTLSLIAQAGAEVLGLLPGVQSH